MTLLKKDKKNASRNMVRINVSLDRDLYELGQLKRISFSQMLREGMIAFQEGYSIQRLRIMLQEEQRKKENVIGAYLKKMDSAEKRIAALESQLNKFIEESKKG